MYAASGATAKQSPSPPHLHLLPAQAFGPNVPLELVVVGDDLPILLGTSGGQLNATIQGNVTFSAIFPNGTVVAAFTLAVDVDAIATAAVSAGLPNYHAPPANHVFFCIHLFLTDDSCLCLQVRQSATKAALTANLTYVGVSLSQAWSAIGTIDVSLIQSVTSFICAKVLVPEVGTVWGGVRVLTGAMSPPPTLRRPLTPCPLKKDQQKGQRGLPAAVV